MTNRAINQARGGPAAYMGWDIGGANIKAARLTPAGLRVEQRAFAIWQRRDDLTATLAEIAAQLGPAHVAGVTMTAELSDAFRTKREGVAFVLDALESALPESQLLIFGVDGHFHDLSVAYDQPLLVAAANWLATALLVARNVTDCLLVDIGSTTTDIVPVVRGEVAARGRNDPERLMAGELIYTGALRTPICAMVQRVPLWGGWCRVAAEHFATSQDVHLLLGNLTSEQCASPTADGRPATSDFAAERLARVVCADIEMLSDAEIRAIGQYVAEQQTQQITDAIAQIRATRSINGPIIAAGVGTFLIEAAASRLGIACQPLATPLGDAASYAAPAAALALLVSERYGMAPDLLAH